MPEPAYDLVTIGASVAGVAAAEAFRRLLPDARVLMVDSDPQAPYDKPALSKEFLAGGSGVAPTPLGDASFWSSVDLWAGRAARGIGEGTVYLDGGSVPARTCVVATGCSARGIDGVSGAGNTTPLRTLADATRLRELASAARAPVIVGAGFIGLEVASVLSSRGMPVQVVELRDRPLVDSLGSTVSDWLRAVHESRGVVFHTGRAVTAGRRDRRGNISGVELSDGTVLDCDLLLVGVGVVPNTAWLGGALAAADGLSCDEYLRTEVPGVFAAGDVARYFDAGRGTPERIEHWTSARAQGDLAGRNAARLIRGEPLEMYLDVPYVWSDQCGSQLQIVGSPALGRERLDMPSEQEASGLFCEFVDDTGEIVGAVAVNAPRPLMKLRRELVVRARRRASLTPTRDPSPGVAEVAARTWSTP